LDKDEDVRPEVIEKMEKTKAFLRSQPKWSYLSKYGNVFDGNKLYEKSKKKPHIDRYFYMTMAEISAGLVWRDIRPSNKPKAWTYTYKPSEKFSKPHPNKFHFYKKR